MGHVCTVHRQAGGDNGLWPGDFQKGGSVFIVDDKNYTKMHVCEHMCVLIGVFNFPIGK